MNIKHLIEMGGYGLYVWPAYFITLLVFAINIVVIFFEKKQTKKLLKNYFADHNQSS